MKSIVFAVAVVALTNAAAGLPAKAEIMCTEQGGCWETGKHIRLIHSVKKLLSRAGTARAPLE